MKKRNFDYRTICHIEFNNAKHRQSKVLPLWCCVINYFVLGLSNIIRFKYKYPTTKDICFIVQSQNNINTLKPISKELRTANYSFVQMKQFPLALSFIYSLLYLKSFFGFYFSSSKEEKHDIRYSYRYFLRAPGYYVVAKKFLKRNPMLKCMIFANDHTVPTRCLIEVAMKNNVATIYTQHASITERFPPLHFSYSFLDGQESYEKYEKIGGIRGIVFLLGSPRFDDIKKQIDRNGTHKNTIGIALGKSESIEKVLNISRYIKENLGYNVVIRPHPAEAPHFNFDLFLSEGFTCSQSEKETSFSFLSRLDFLIANRSGIHLDAAIKGIPSVMYNFSDYQVLDWYGFVKKGLIKIAENEEQVVQYIKELKPAPTKVVQYYYAAFGTQLDGHIAKTIAEFIEFGMYDKERFYDKFFTEEREKVYSIKESLLC